VILKKRNAVIREMANLVQASETENASSSIPLPREPMMNTNLPICPNWFGPPVFGYMYPAWVLTVQQPSGGIYPVQCQVLPFMGAMPDFYPGGLIPIAYTVPSSSGVASPVEVTTQRTEPAPQNAPAANEAHQRHGPPNGDAQGRRQEHHQRQRFLRLIIGFQLGLLLMLKLVLVVFVFNKTGSKDRLRLMMFLNIVNLVYLYQIGAFAPLLRWLSHSARRAMIPAHTAQDQHNDTSQVAQAQERGNLNWQGLTKEVQMVVIGFVASLFPGFRISDQN